MACKPTNLSILACANGFTLWHYTTTDSTTKVENQGYFNKAANILQANDMIICNTRNSACIFTVICIVQGEVDVKNLIPQGE